jgi:hypothetical protein
MKCGYETCDAAPRHTLRAKTGPGQWQMISGPCEEHLADAVQTVRDEQPHLVGGLQVIPFAKRDWPTEGAQ